MLLNDFQAFIITAKRWQLSLQLRSVLSKDIHFICFKRSALRQDPNNNVEYHDLLSRMNLFLTGFFRVTNSKLHISLKISISLKGLIYSAIYII